MENLIKLFNIAKNHKNLELKITYDNLYLWTIIINNEEENKVIFYDEGINLTILSQQAFSKLVNWCIMENDFFQDCFFDNFI